MWVAGQETKDGMKVSIFDTEKNATLFLLGESISSVESNEHPQKILATAYANVLYGHTTAREAMDDAVVTAVLDDVHFNWFIVQDTPYHPRFADHIPTVKSQAGFPI
jgi:sulfur relay (sulfurtransferase) DsrF/TusC family protein